MRPVPSPPPGHVPARPELVLRESPFPQEGRAGREAVVGPHSLGAEVSSWLHHFTPTNPGLPAPGTGKLCLLSLQESCGSKSHRLTAPCMGQCHFLGALKYVLLPFHTLKQPEEQVADSLLLQAGHAEHLLNPPVLQSKWPQQFLLNEEDTNELPWPGNVGEQLARAASLSVKRVCCVIAKLRTNTC